MKWTVDPVELCVSLGMLNALVLAKELVCTKCGADVGCEQTYEEQHGKCRTCYLKAIGQTPVPFDNNL